jgi:acid phosphatase type 7
MLKKLALLIGSVIGGGFLIVALVAASPGGAVYQVAGSNLVQNPSFEIQGTSSTDAASWMEGASHTRANDKFNTGSWSLKSTFTGAGTHTQQTVSVTANSNYIYSAYVWKGATNTSSGTCADMNDIAGELQVCATTTGAWQFMTGTWNSNSNTSVTLRLITDGNPNAGSWFDDVSLASQATPTPISTLTSTPTTIPAASNVVQNPSFETQGTSSTDAANWIEGVNHTRASDKFNTGSWSLKSTFMSAGGSHTQQTVAVAMNVNYIYSVYFWKAATNATSGTCADMSDLGGEVQLCASTTGAWQLQSGTWNSGSNTSVTLRLITDGTPNAGSWFDDVSLAPQATPTPSPTPTRTPTPCPSCPTSTPTATPGTIVVAGAGDIACGVGSSGAACKQGATSDLLLSINPDKVINLGDNQYEDGSLTNFQNFYDPTWGRVKAKTSPALGNHEYLTSGAAGYFDYFNGVGNLTGSAGDRGLGYYSYDLGNWHFVVLNSNCTQVSCSVGSAQYTWLQNNLAADNHPCSIAYMHHPLASSDTRNFDASTPFQPLLQLFYADGGDLVLVGHSHFYERFARMDANRNADPAYGFRYIVVGTGGRNVYGFGVIRPLSEIRNSDSFGVIKLTLRANNYTWDFMPAAGYTFTDTGTEDCHGPHP